MGGCGACTQCGDGECRQAPPTSELPTDRPLVVWDGQCTFCRRWMKRYHALAGDTLAWAPLEDAESYVPGVSRDELEKAVHLVERDGTVRAGAQAIYAIMAHVGLRRWPSWLHRRLPPFRWISNGCYRWIARHRGGANSISTALHGPVATPSTWLLTRRVFLRLLGLIYVLAFVSLGQQALALFGESGLQPIDVLVTAWSDRDEVAWWRLPTLQWLGGDGLITATWIVGAVAGALLMLGVGPLLMTVVCWVAYLSLVNAGGVFLQFQWDALLLEVGFLAMLWAPMSMRLNSPGTRRPSAVVHWMLVLLLARFVFFSGLVKLQSGDVTWADCTALSYHLWTQPLPWWPAWWFHQMPEWIMQAMCVVMFIIELGTPILLFLPRVPRTIASVSVIVLMLSIAVTGNYGFFNWLTIVLCLAMLDDATLLYLWPRVVRGRMTVGLRRLSATPVRVVRCAGALLVLSIVVPLTWSALARQPAPWLLGTWNARMAPWHLASHYGLFANMTTTRPEIHIEATMDGEHWEPVVFKFKPGPLDRAPGLVQPFMPRLDWQMWFDALSYEHLFRAGALSQNPGRLRFTSRQVLPALMRHLSNGTPRVLDLLESTPMGPGERAVAMRWRLDAYRFTTLDDSDTANWWQRERLFNSPRLELRPSPRSP